MRRYTQCSMLIEKSADSCNCVQCTMCKCTFCHGCGVKYEHIRQTAVGGPMMTVSTPVLKVPILSALEATI